ncbi:MAG: TolC family protein, partial [Crocinitomicaceae bacterium]|nr:TolC family protein [Crocinitomicaceae bacterium]
MRVIAIKICAFLFLLIVGTGTVVAQNAPEREQKLARSINLETVLKLGGANSLTIKEFKQREAIALADVSKAKEWWLPTVYAGTSFHQLWGNAMNAQGTILQDVNRQNFSAGLGINATWDFGYGIFKVDAAEFKAEAAVYKTQAEQNKALLQIINTYYDFLSAQLYLRAYQELVVGADTIIAQIQTQVDADLRYPSELLLAKSNLNHLKVEMYDSQIQFDTKSAELIGLLNLDPNIGLMAGEDFLVPLKLVDIYDYTSFTDSSYKNRPEYQYLEQLMLSVEA